MICVGRGMHGVLAISTKPTFIGCALYAVLSMLAVGSARSQTPDVADVRVVVTSSDGRRLGDADVVIVRAGLGWLSARTDERGVAAFSFAADTAAYSVAVRKIGFGPRSVVMSPVAGHTLDIALSLTANAPSLDTVRTIAEQLRSKNYHIAATEIASSHRAIYDAYDAASKLRPNMLGDRGRLCPGVKNLWINGQRVFWKTSSATMVTRVSTAPAASGRIVATGGGSGGSGGAPGLRKFLQSIKSEDIADMQYANCWDTSSPNIGTNDALFIRLKPGIEWNWNEGSHRAPSSLSSAAATYPRLLGIYDDKTGSPIDGAEVIDSVSTLEASTTRTGTVSLGFLRASSAVLTIRKIGYNSLRLLVTLTVNDTTPITILLVPTRP